MHTFPSLSFLGLLCGFSLLNTLVSCKFVFFYLTAETSQKRVVLLVMRNENVRTSCNTSQI